jgi:hypothetical protein
MLRRASLALALLAASCAHYPRLSLSTSMRLEADTHLFDLSHMDAKEDDWVVHVLARGGSCSGALVEPGVVLTARHCVTSHDEPGSVYDAGDVRVELGGDYLPWGRVGVVGVVTCPCYRDSPRGDVTALILEASLPPEVPTRRVRLAAEPAPDEDILAAGFGALTPSKSIPDTGWPQRALFRGTWSGVTTSVADGSFILSGRAFPGDSGGPVWSRETGEILGVVSQGTEGTRADDGTERVPYTVAARVDTCAGILARAHAIAIGAPEGTWPSVVCR